MDFEANISQVVKSYGFVDDFKIHKLRSVYKISSHKKDFLIKKFNSKTKLLNTKKILKHLSYNNFKNVQHMYYNLNNEFYFEIDGKFYACFSWINGREVNIKNHREVKKCTKIIYLFHEALKNTRDDSIILKDESNWIEKFENDILNLYHIKDKLHRKSSLCLIDKFYYENIERSVEIITKIIDDLIRYGFKDFYEDNKIICHNSLYYQNFILNNNGKVYLIDFGGLVLNNRVYDVARFARRVFYKNNFKFRVLNDIYENYNNYYKFSKFEEMLFKNHLKYPYKFVRLGQKFYIKNKDISEDKLLEKLKKYSDYELKL